MSSKRTGLQLLIERVTSRDLADLLRELYVDRRHSDAEIAAFLSGAVGSRIPRSTVQSWRLQFGISRDERPEPALSA